MKSKKFITIMAIFIILCSIQAISAFEDNNVTRTDVQPIESDTLGADVITIDNQSEESKVQNNDMNDNDLEVSNSIVSSSAPQDCISLNPKQPLYGSANVGNLIFDNDPTLRNLIQFIFKKVSDNISSDMSMSRNLTLEWNIFLGNNTFTGGYGDGNVYTINTGYMSETKRATYITFRNYNPQTKNYDENLNITINLYGGRAKDDGLTSTVDLSQYGADYRFIDLSGGSSTITGVNFKNFNINNYNNTKKTDTSMPFIFFGDDKIQNNKSSLINCTFENITLNSKQPIVRMAYIDSPQDISVISESGGIIDGCVFRNNHASQMIAISGSKSDSSHSVGGPIFYGFEASNNLFENNRGTMEQNSTSQSSGLCIKIWNEASNVTLNNNRFVNNTNALYGAAYSIDGFNANITNNYFEGNEAVFGSCINVNNGNITIKYCTFVNNVAKGNNTQHQYRQGSGAAIALLGSNNYIFNCTFKNNTAHGHAGAIDIVAVPIRLSDGTEYLVANNTIIESSRFFDNLAMDYAGGVNDNGTNTLIDNCTFEGNIASFAGAIRLIGENSTVRNSSFVDNNAIQGGACYIEGEDILVEKSKFNENHATHTDLRFPLSSALTDMQTEGGAIHIIGKNIKITSSEFNDNVADAKTASEKSLGGGAVYIKGINTTISDSTFDNNTALRGGAMYIDIEETKVIGCNFTDNSAFNYDEYQGLGGAVYLDCADNTEIKESRFVNNIAGINGGAVFWIVPEGDINGRILDSVFDNNSAAANAGAVYWYGSNGAIIGSNFTNNRANGTSRDYNYNSGDGGAIVWTGSDGSLKDCVFENNYAKHNGGAVNWMEEAYGGNITESVFENNAAENNGGAVFWNGLGGLLENSNFTSNNATQGGAVYWSCLEGQILGSRFISNNATLGGAIFLENCTFHESIAITITKSYFETNTAVDGGAIYWNKGTGVYIKESSFTENTADSRGGAIFVNGAYGEITDSQFTLNEAILGGAAYLNNEELTVSGSDFTTNNAVQGGAVYIGGQNNVISDSYFNYNNAAYSLRVDTSKNKDKTKGGAIYIGGENNVIEDSEFIGNVANATNDTAVIVQTTPGLLGAYLDVAGVGDDGLGGAIFIGADGNNITGKNEFRDNIARNGSAVYNDASGTYFKGGTFYKNQAWSYVLEVNGTNKTCCKDNIINKIYYGADVEIKLYNYIAGDNILNGIYNARNVGDVTFNSVEYIINDDIALIKTTLASDTNPELGAKEGMLYQDSLERYQHMVISVRCNETGQIVANKTVLTDLYGNYSFDLSGLKPGNYTIVAYHPEDMNYKHIIAANVFEVVPLVDLSIKKAIAEDPILVGDNAVFTIVVSNAANASEATNVIINEVLPNGLAVVDVNASVGTYDSSSNIWHIDKLANGTQATLVLTAKTSKVGLFNNTVIVSCDDKEWNYTNNNDTSIVKVMKASSYINTDGLITVYNSGGILFVSLTGIDGEPLAGRGIKVNITGKTYTIITNASGIAGLPINLKAGLHPSYVWFNGDATYAPSENVSTSVEVYTDSRITGNKDFVKRQGDSQPFKVRALDKYGKPVGAYAKVKMTVAGKTYTVFTDANGYASLPINLKAGKYKITTSYGGTTVTNTITVKK